MTFLQTTYDWYKDALEFGLGQPKVPVPSTDANLWGYRPPNRPEPIAHLYVPQLAAMPFPRRGRQSECLDRFLMIAGRDDFVLVYHKHGMGDVDTGIEQRHALDLPSPFIVRANCWPFDVIRAVTGSGVSSNHE